MEKTTFDPFVLVTEFIDTFEASPLQSTWLTLIQEETEEVLEAMEADLKHSSVQTLANVLKESIDLQYVMIGAIVTASRIPNAVDLPMEVVFTYLEVTDAVAQFVPGSDLREVFRRVHQSNMSKLGEDGKPIRREDGKVLKGPNYAPADLTDIAYRLHLALGREEF